MRRRPLLLAAIAAAIAGLGYAWWWSRPAVQAPATFRRIERAIAGLDAGDLLAEVHRDYDLRGHWEETIGRHGEADVLAGPNPRQAVANLLRQAFLLHLGNRLAFAWRINAIRQLPGGAIEVLADIGLRAEQPTPLRIDPPLQNLRFVLAREGWWPRLRIRDHDPVPLP